MPNKFLSLFRDPSDVYLTKPMKKKKRKLMTTTYSIYGLFSFLYLTQVFIALAFKFKLFEAQIVNGVDTTEIKVSGWVLLIAILTIYFTGKRIVTKLKKISETTRSV